MSDWTVNRFRTARGRVLRQQIDRLAAHLGRPIVILDVGGRQDYWRNVGTDNVSQIRLLNNDGDELTRGVVSGIFSSEMGDACHLSTYDDKSIDLVHSNSVIEHVGNWTNMAAMAREVRRVGRSGWIQTPAWAFPIEPHFKVPFMHWLGQPMRRRMLRFSRDYGNLSVAEQRFHIDRINLLCYGEFRSLFDDADIFIERLVLPKSYSARWYPYQLN